MSALYVSAGPLLSDVILSVTPNIIIIINEQLKIIEFNNAAELSLIFPEQMHLNLIYMRSLMQKAFRSAGG